PQACRTVCDHLRSILPGSPLLLADSGHSPFNRAASRNLGVRHTPDNEVVVVCDADLLLEQQPLLDAINAAQDGALHYPFTLCYYLDPAETAPGLAGTAPQATASTTSLHGAQGGAMVMLAAAWRAIGGMDDAF